MMKSCVHRVRQAHTHARIHARMHVGAYARTNAMHARAHAAHPSRAHAQAPRRQANWSVYQGVSSLQTHYTLRRMIRARTLQPRPSKCHTCAVCASGMRWLCLA
uniref:Uncharacterized protein n=1 Tax=Chrysotila carterae TaxID=13221 RepID=A0A7S4BSY3_CHRCT